MRTGSWVEGLVGRRPPACNQEEQAAAGKKANPRRPHPLPHLRTSAETEPQGAAAATALDPHIATPGTLTSSSCGLLMDYSIPDYILKPDSEQVTVDSAPCCPVVVFINSRSGGQLGSSLIKTYRELLNEVQVFDLSEEALDKVLLRIYCIFEKLKSNGDLVATQIQKSSRLI
ncbi:diacylglycerol kinase 1-like [Miscanthus floridulus]|uniref:diacylglycerol kinase 1-like n=1 Tax=Miscanthus floridulus TaxID=154761 RepID=UPI0034592C79